MTTASSVDVYDVFFATDGQSLANGKKTMHLKQMPCSCLVVILVDGFCGPWLRPAPHSRSTPSPQICSVWTRQAARPSVPMSLARSTACSSARCPTAAAAPRNPGRRRRCPAFASVPLGRPSRSGSAAAVVVAVAAAAAKGADVVVRYLLAPFHFWSSVSATFVSALLRQVKAHPSLLLPIPGGGRSKGSRQSRDGSSSVGEAASGERVVHRA